MAKQPTKKPALKKVTRRVARVKLAKTEEKRRSIRFKPDLGDFALIQTKGRSFFPALIVNESYTGACLTCVVNQDVQPGAKISAKIGKLSLLPAEIVWVEDIDAEVLKFGIEYIE